MFHTVRGGKEVVSRYLQRVPISQREAELLECFRRMEHRDQESLLRFGAVLARQKAEEPPT